MVQQIFRDNWRNGLEIKFEAFRNEQVFYCKGRRPEKGDLIKTNGPTFVVTTVQRESSMLYRGSCIHYS